MSRLLQFLRWGIVMSVIYANAASAEDVLELTCFNSTWCRKFEHGGINAACVDQQCQCSNLDGLQVHCRPASTLISNFIGGICPCTQPHADCNTAQNVCYCDSDYSPSDDKRRCLSVHVPLGSKCELDAQCHSLDPFAHCYVINKTQHSCQCQTDYERWSGNSPGVEECVARLNTSRKTKANDFCSDPDCQADSGEQAFCSTSGECLCLPGFVASSNKSVCLAASSLQGNCMMEAQCQSTLGPAGRCLAGKCACQMGYEAHILPYQHRSGRKMWCVRKAFIGKYCLSDDDCHNISPLERSMVCQFGQCNCRLGYAISPDGLHCIGNSSIKLHASLWWPLILIALALQPLSAKRTTQRPRTNVGEACETQNN